MLDLSSTRALVARSLPRTPGDPAVIGQWQIFTLAKEKKTLDTAWPAHIGLNGINRGKREVSPAASTILMVITGALYVGLGVPMALRMVAPNGWYGVRTATTAASPEVWYAVNAGAGIAVSVAGAVVICGTLLLYFLLGGAEPRQVLYGNLGIFLATNFVLLFVIIAIHQAA